MTWYRKTDYDLVRLVAETATSSPFQDWPREQTGAADMTWSLDYARSPERVASLTKLNATTPIRFDGIGSSGGLGTPVRQVLARTQFSGSPGREQEAAEAWAFELKCYFHRGVGEQPEVSYADGVYTVTGLIQTTHPGDIPGPDGILWVT